MTDPSKDVKGKNFHKNNSMETTANTAKNIVIAHGAFADGSSYKELYKILTKKGFNVTIVQNPLTTFCSLLSICEVFTYACYNFRYSFLLG
jgi:hypothetical protein